MMGVDNCRYVNYVRKMCVSKNRDAFLLKRSVRNIFTYSIIIAGKKRT